jgi:hypothetical protein
MSLGVLVLIFTISLIFKVISYEFINNTKGLWRIYMLRKCLYKFIYETRTLPYLLSLKLGLCPWVSLFDVLVFGSNDFNNLAGSDTDNKDKTCVVIGVGSNVLSCPPLL